MSLGFGLRLLADELFSRAPKQTWTGRVRNKHELETKEFSDRQNISDASSAWFCFPQKLHVSHLGHRK